MATQYTAGLTTGQVLTAATMNSIGAAWVDYTPTLTQSGAVTKTITTARYCQIQKTIIVNLNLAVTGSGGGASAVAIGLPFASNNANAVIGSGFFYDSSTNTIYNVSAAADAGATFSTFYQTGSNWGVSPAITLANADQIRFCLSYEVA